MVDCCVKTVKIFQTCYQLSSAVTTTHKTSSPVDPTSSLSYLGPKTPQDYGTGLLTNYTKDAWQGTDYKVCTGINKSKETENSVLRQGTQLTAYTVR